VLVTNQNFGVKMKTFQKTVELIRDGKIDTTDVLPQLDRITKKSIGDTYRNMGWAFQTPEVLQIPNQTLAKLRLFKRVKRDRSTSSDVFNEQYARILERIARLARSNAWRLKDAAVVATVKADQPKQNFSFPLPTEIINYFKHIYDRDSQIRVIHSSLAAAQASGFEQRNHCLLWGKTGCGKTETVLAFEKMVGEHNVIKLDATSTTKAGAENLLLELDVIPPILMIEELEKCNPLNLPWLLGVLDQRGEIIKTNARVGSLRKMAKCLCVATVNNLDELTRMMSGALASRFQHKIYFPRPSRAILEKILVREIGKVNGKFEWIKPILDYVLDIEQVNDPRRAIALLDGRDKWLGDCEYRKDLEAIHNSMKADQVEWPTN
jgi:hypothetical protein